MKKQNLTIAKLIQDLEEWYPNVTPTEKLAEFEYGVLAGQRRLIENLKIYYETNSIKEETDK